MGGLAIALLAIVVGSVGVVAWLDLRDVWDDLVAIGTVATATGVVLAGISGSFGLLRPSALLAGALAVGAGGLGLGGTVGIARAVRRWRTRVLALVALARTSRWSIVLVALATIGSAWQVVVAIVLPPFAYDGLSYRLTMVADWVQHGDLRVSDLSLCCARYPLSPELLMAWPMTMTRSDAIVQLTQLPLVALAATATAGLARLAGAAVAGQVAAAAVFVTTPWVLAQATATYVDLVIAGWALAGLYWVVRYASSRRTAHLVLAAVAAGLVIGAKGVGLLWGLALTVALVAVVVRRHGPGRAALVRVGGAAVLVGAIGGGWYVRNWIQAGNPVAPFEVTLAGRTIFDGATTVGDVATLPPGGSRFGTPGEIAFSWLGDLLVWQHPGYDYQQRRGGLGPGWVLLGLPATVVMSVWSVRNRAPIGIAVAVTAAVFAVQPYRWWARFTPVLAALGAVAVVWAVGRLSTNASRRLRSALIVVATWSVGIVSHEVRPSGNAAGIPATEIVSLIGAPAEERTLQSLVHAEYRFLDRLPPDATVSVDLRTPALRFVFPLFGPDLGRRVEPIVDGRVPLDGSWVVTGPGRPVDVALVAGGQFELVVDGDIRVWSPSAPSPASSTGRTP